MSGDAYPEEPPDVSRVPDAVPRHEPHSRGGNRSSYEVWGKTYHVLPDASGYAKQGTASWYGEKFHGYATSNGEIYDMYKMSAAHRSLPLPTFARVTSLDNGRSVIVRVNDRGPFHSDREIDLSYAAAARLDILDNGTGRVRVEAIDVDRWLAENGGSNPVAGADRRGVSQQAAAATTSVAREAPAAAVRPAEERSAEARPADRRPTEGRPTEGRPSTCRWRRWVPPTAPAPCVPAWRASWPSRCGWPRPRAHIASRWAPSPAPIRSSHYARPCSVPASPRVSSSRRPSDRPRPPSQIDLTRVVQ